MATRSKTATNLATKSVSTKTKTNKTSKDVKVSSVAKLSIHGDPGILYPGTVGASPAIAASLAIAAKAINANAEVLEEVLKEIESLKAAVKRQDKKIKQLEQTLKEV